MPKKKQYLVVGLGGFGVSVMRTLLELGQDVLAIDEDEYVVQELSETAAEVVQADATDEIALRALGVRNFDVAIVSMAKNLEASILATMLLKEMGVNLVISKAEDELHGKILQKIGADKVVFPERDMGMRVANNLVSGSVLEFIELSPDYSILEISVPKKFIGKTLRDIDMGSSYGINVIALKKSDAINVTPGADEPLLAETSMIVIGSNENLNEFRDDNS